IRRSAIPVANAARRATSCRACFLLPTRNWAITLRGVSSSAISITIRFPTPQTSVDRLVHSMPSVLPRKMALLARAANTSGPVCVAASRPQRRVDPADIAVAAAIDQVQLALRAVAEQQHRRIGQIHAHDRLADGELRHL